VTFCDAAELSPAPNAAELATLFGLDPLFVDAALAQLESLKAVTRGKGGAVSLTTQGKQFAKAGQAMQLAEHKVLSFMYRSGLEDLQLGPLATQLGIRFIPIDLGFHAPAITLRHARLSLH